MGPLLAVVFMAVLANDVRSVMWVAVLPAFIAAGLVGCVREPTPQQQLDKGSPLSLAETKRLEFGLLVNRFSRRSLHAGAIQ